MQNELGNGYGLSFHKGQLTASDTQWVIYASLITKLKIGRVHTVLAFMQCGYHTDLLNNAKL